MGFMKSGNDKEAMAINEMRWRNSFLTRANKCKANEGSK